MHHVRSRLWCHTSRQHCVQRHQLEKHWSSAAAEQLLRLPRNDRDADVPIFSSGLAECKFQDYQIDTNQQVRQLHASAGLAAVPLRCCQKHSSMCVSGSAGHAANGAHVLCHLVSVTDFLSVSSVPSVTVCGGPWRHTCQPHTGKDDTVRTSI